MSARCSTDLLVPQLGDLRGPFGQRYEILSLLARGGQGAIYVADDRQNARRVALKIVESGDGDAQDLHARLMLEARIGARLACEQIVDVLDAGRDSRTGLSFLTMELLEGCDLQQLVECRGPLAPELVVEYLQQVASGLDLAHGCLVSGLAPAPIVHRDLKPANLFLSQAPNGNASMKILDFGIAKILERYAQASIQLRGTPLYMAAEQVTGAPISPATDIWAFGLIAFFLLTGRPYWIAGQPSDCNLQRLFREVAAGATEPPSRRAQRLNLGVALPKAFDQWFLRCVHRRPNRRFASAGIAAAALAKALTLPLARVESRRINRPTPVLCRDATKHKSGAELRGARRWLWLGLGTCLGLGAVLGGAVEVRFLSESTRSRRDALTFDARRGRSQHFRTTRSSMSDPRCDPIVYTDVVTPSRPQSRVEEVCDAPSRARVAEGNPRR